MEDGELLIEREILAGGKSRAFVGSRPVAVSLLKDLAPHLGDIHGQHDQQLLFSARCAARHAGRVRRQRRTVGRVAEIYEQWRAAARGTGGAGAHGTGETAPAGPVGIPAEGDRGRGAAAGEDAALENERRVLQNVGACRRRRARPTRRFTMRRNRRCRWRALAAKRLDELCRIDSSLAAMREQLKAADLSLGGVLRIARLSWRAGGESRPAGRDGERGWQPSTS